MRRSLVVVAFIASATQTTGLVRGWSRLSNKARTLASASEGLPAKNAGPRSARFATHCPNC
jgi:hypothetical protein